MEYIGRIERELHGLNMYGSRLFRGLRNGLYGISLASAVLTGACNTPNAQSYNTPTPSTSPAIVTRAPTASPSPITTPRPSPTPTPLQSCDDIPNVPYKPNVIIAADRSSYSVEIVVSQNVENRTTSCQTDGIEIRGEPVFINRVKQVIGVLKELPEYYDYVKNYVTIIEHDELRKGIGATNDKKRTAFLTYDILFYPTTEDGDRTALIEGAEAIRHEANWIELWQTGKRNTGDNKGDYIKIAKDDINLLAKFSNLSSIRALIEIKYKIIEDCKNSTKENPIISFCAQ